MRGVGRAMGGLLLALALCGTGLLPADAVAGGKLLYMENGRVLKAVSVAEESGWLTVTLEGGSTIGFEAVAMERVEDAPESAEDLGSGLNVVTSGRDVAVRSYPPPQDQTLDALQEMPQQDEIEALQQEAAQDPAAAEQQLQERLQQQLRTPPAGTPADRRGMVNRRFGGRLARPGASDN